ncbi:Dicarboxylate/amino acid:cation (Na or H) symporter (DAACS) family protein [Phytophthora cinnamomi]|uniref:Dicarboxylate/amino acid:cation (Na or H) symporter (DAACS) family protein n=2 Tax=Phytophthora cinnamomi TaxID=4785 RepID=UPI00355A72D9|nr:Dicarboxylate/amino acid:cation (Na or H) symporter (DAACS) family protein [Phytophthora cinnamomi]
MAQQKADFAVFDRSIVKDGGNSEVSAPSLMSPVSGFSSETGSSFFYGGGGGYAHAANARPAPPYSATLRTNFTSAANDQSAGARPNSVLPPAAQDEASESPDAAFRHFRTPANDPGLPFSGFAAAASPAYGRTSKRSMLFIIVAIVVGSVVGVLLKHFNVDASVAEWIMTPGNLFVRAVQCVVVPMVLVNLVVATADITSKGLGKRLGLRVTLVLLVSVIAAILQGMLTGVIMHSVFSSYQNEESTSTTDPIFGIQCGNGKYLEADDNGLVTCSATEVSGSSQFALDDVNSALVRNEALTGTNTSLSDNVLSIIDQVVPDNIMAAFISNTLLSIVAFSLPLGATIAYSFHGPTNLNPLLEFSREVNETLMHMVHWILRFTPFAVLSLLAGSLAKSLEDSVSDHPLRLVLLVVAALAVSVLVHMLVIVPGVFVVFTRRNPFRFMRQMLPAYVYSIGCSSSMATMPLSLHCMEITREVPCPIMHFVLSVGTSLHMPGTAIYLAMLVHFMADVAGVTGVQSTTAMLTTFLGVFLCTITAPPVPSGALTVLTAAWNIVFPDAAIPDSLYALVVASDVFLDRFVTLCNVNAQAMLCRVVADQVEDKGSGNGPHVQVQQYAAR